MDQSKGINVYFISGLGADERVFRKLTLPEGFHPKYLTWIPFEKNESLESYARRLSAGVDITQPFVLVGLSLGGMIASEIQRFLQPVLTILISSASNHKQLPFYFSIGRILPLHRWIPLRWQFKWRQLAFWIIGIKTDEDKRLFYAFLQSADPQFMERATDAVLQWKRKEAPTNYVHIHGSGDRIIPIQFVTPTHIVKGGSHFMVFNRAEEVSEILKEVLENIEPANYVGDRLGTRNSE